MKLLALDTSTDTLQLAATDGQQVWQHSGPGGAAASSSLIPAILALLAQSGMRLPQLDAIVFGAGPGSFTGLRTACAVAQGLAFGLGLPVLPVNSLLALAEQARHQYGVQRVLAVLDARMGEVYAQSYDFESPIPHAACPGELLAPDNLPIPLAWRDQPASWLLAGNAFAAHGARLVGRLSSAQQAGLVCPLVLPSAVAMLRLAPALLEAGAGVSAAQAHPHYVRNRVAQTTQERERARNPQSAVQALAA